MFKIINRLLSINKERNIIDSINKLSEISINAMNRMTPMDISLSNLRFDFGEKPELVRCGINCISQINGDARDLTIAFGNNLVAYKGPLLYYNEVIIKAMEFMTGLAIEHSPFWVKWNVDIPETSLVSVAALDDFIKTFDLTKTKSYELLQSEGKK